MNEKKEPNKKRQKISDSSRSLPSELPVEIWAQVFSFLKRKELLHLSLTNKNFYYISTSDLFWKPKFEKLIGSKYGVKFQRHPNDTRSYYSLYQEELRRIKKEAKNLYAQMALWRTWSLSRQMENEYTDPHHIYSLIHKEIGNYFFSIKDNVISRVSVLIYFFNDLSKNSFLYEISRPNYFFNPYDEDEESGVTFLEWMAVLGDSAACKFLVEKKVDVDPGDNDAILNFVISGRIGVFSTCSRIGHEIFNLNNVHQLQNIVLNNDRIKTIKILIEADACLTWGDLYCFFSDEEFCPFVNLLNTSIPMDIIKLCIDRQQPPKCKSDLNYLEILIHYATLRRITPSEYSLKRASEAITYILEKNNQGYIDFLDESTKEKLKELPEYNLSKMSVRSPNF